jgi:hypothetical protein
MNHTVSSTIGFAALAIFAVPAFADSVKGEFTLEGKPPTKPSAVLAFAKKDGSKDVILSVKPLNRDRILKSSDPLTAVMNDDASESGYMEFVVSADGSVSMNANFGAREQYLDSTKGDLLASCPTNSAERVVCTVKSKKLVKFMDDPGWALDVAFDAMVQARTAK